MDHICGPITAIAFIRLKSRLLLLAGEGPLLRVYNESTKKPLCSRRIFDNQAIHGITPTISPDASFGKDCSTECLIWGGCSICVVRIDSYTEFADQAELKIQDLVSELQVEDWILDVCLNSSSQSTSIYVSEAVLITSHNVLLRFRPPNSSSTAKRRTSVGRMAAGPRSILYSAHVIWPSNGRGLVAAGTVYGEVLLWSFGHDTTFHPTPPAGVLHYTFKGHEGSIFGVKMSEEYLSAESGTSRRILASCSDDRTIKIWEISLSNSNVSCHNLQVGLPKIANAGDDSQNEVESNPLATAMGHASRIWGLHFLYETDSDWHLLSLGEDSSAQIWHLRRQSHNQNLSQKLNDAGSFLLFHRATYKWHSGKNIWSSAVCRKTNNNRLVCTGGSDGRLVYFNLQKQDCVHLSDTFSTQWTVDEVIRDFDSMPKTSNTKSRSQREGNSMPENIFAALEGQWKLHRNLESAKSTYPSGVFDGIALFKKRPPTDPVYSAEYLYIEDGKFTTVQGLSLTATRRYVYRFFKDANTISVWFVKLDDGLTVDYLYHKLDFALFDYASLLVNELENFPVLKAKGYHLCVDDDYHAGYSFRYDGLQFDAWSLKHTVKGPQKDYVADAQYVRESIIEGLKANVDLDQNLDKMSATTIAIIEPEVLESSPQNTDSFKTYTWINETEFLVLTEQGWLLLGNSSISKRNAHLPKASNSLQVCWERIAKIKDLRSSCIGSTVQFHETTILAGASGTVYIYQHSNKSAHYLTKICGKVAYMKSHTLSFDLKKVSKAFKTAIVISCLGSSTVSCLIFNVATRPSDCFKLLDLGIDRLLSFIVTSSCYIEQEDVLILGSRNGALAIYDISRNKIDTGNVTVSQSLDCIHGNDAVNVIEVVPTRFLKTQSDAIFLLTAGRDGRYAIHRIRCNVEGQIRFIDFQTMHVCTPPFGPSIEGACFDEASNDLLLWGFRSKQFVVWNESRKKETMIVECGGSHRNWAFSPSNRGPGGGMLVWTKASTCHVYSQLYASHQVLRYGGHGREIKAMAVSPPIRGLNGSTRRYVATGAEDTSIRIFRRSADNQAESHEPFRCLGIFPRHTTGIQQLRWSCDGQRLFSAAGCEEFLIWRIRSIPCLELGLVCEAQCPPVTESSDLRIMDFDVAEIWDEHHTVQDSRVQAYLLSMVYSDSSVRVRVQTFLPPEPQKNLSRILKRKPTDLPLHNIHSPTGLPTPFHRLIHNPLPHPSRLPPLRRRHPTLHRQHRRPHRHLATNHHAAKTQHHHPPLLSTHMRPHDNP